MAGKAFAERFWEKVAIAGPDDCWPWEKSTDGHGYGQISNRFGSGSPECASRVAWELANERPVPDGLFILHTCDNPPCSNPTHLYPGTQADNGRDMAERVRWRRHVTADVDDLLVIVEGDLMIEDLSTGAITIVAG